MVPASELFNACETADGVTPAGLATWAWVDPKLRPEA